MLKAQAQLARTAAAAVVVKARTSTRERGRSYQKPPLESRPSLSPPPRFDEVTPAQSDATVIKAIELGVRNFDTAPHYGLGLSEERLGAAFGRFSVEGARGYSGLPDGIRVWTKVR